LSCRHANLLFVDSPVGTGFSYVTSNDSYATDNAQITRDLIAFLRFASQMLRTLRALVLNIRERGIHLKVPTFLCGNTPATIG